jgi:hypothetical protein
MKNFLPLALLALCLGACAQARLTVRNDRKSAVTDVEVKAGTNSYLLPKLEAGASDVRSFKVKEASPLAVNYKSAEGGLYYTSSKESLQKGEGRKLLLKLNEKGLLDVEVEK